MHKIDARRSNVFIFYHAVLLPYQRHKWPTLHRILPKVHLAPSNCTQKILNFHIFGNRSLQFAVDWFGYSWHGNMTGARKFIGKTLPGELQQVKENYSVGNKSKGFSLNILKPWTFDIVLGFLGTIFSQVWNQTNALRITKTIGFILSKFSLPEGLSRRTSC